MALLYLKEFDFERRTNPRKEPNRLVPMHHPENVFIDTLTYNKVDLNGGCNQDNVLYGYSPIRCNVILTNTNHDGIWLCRNNHNDLTLISKDMDYCYKEMMVYNRVYYALTEAMIDTIYYNGKQFPYDETTSYARKFGLAILQSFRMTAGDVIPNIYYNYYLDKYPYTGTYHKRIDLFLICEVDVPTDHILPFTNYQWYDDMVWYPRSEHYSLSSYKYDSSLKRVLDVGCNYDIRFDPVGRILLDRIFNMEEIFGKLDIY